ncbi:phage tail terminator-like protein [Xenophilus sp. Marseille-Q4582]|uniref:phage tail terminator-like protein n=1 Tax=Xenophilus sp. Marseille-Q4582 TaxID=2866600 RepID=UPI001CE42D9E|nr:phage tail terminator-like protein [Xenophilus sp. Marseille-Q4582]
MSIVLVRRALEKRLAALTPALPTAWENAAFTPVTGQAWQRATVLRNTPLGLDLAGQMTELRGDFRIGLFYPVGVGTATAEARAELLRAHFGPVQRLTEAGVTVHLTSPVYVGSAVPDDGWLHVPVAVYWRAFTN